MLWARRGGLEFNWVLSWRWHILSILLEGGRGISAETFGLYQVFPLDNLGSGPYTYTCHVRVGVTMTVWWCWYYFLLGSKCVFQLYNSGFSVSWYGIGTMWQCALVSCTPSQSILADSKVHGANMGPTWVLSAPDGPHVGPTNLAIRVALGVSCSFVERHYVFLLLTHWYISISLW